MYARVVLNLSFRSSCSLLAGGSSVDLGVSSSPSSSVSVGSVSSYHHVLLRYRISPAA